MEIVVWLTISATVAFLLGIVVAKNTREALGDYFLMAMLFMFFAGVFFWFMRWIFEHVRWIS